MDQRSRAQRFETSNRLVAASADAEFQRLSDGRKAVALPLAIEALKALNSIGFRAWIIGSLAKGHFSPHSDIDIAVDCPREREYEAFRVIEKAVGDFPFHMVPCNRIAEDARALVMEGALDASSLSAS